MNNEKTGDLFTPADLCEAIEIQQTFMSLTIFQRYYFKAKAIYYTMRGWVIGLLVAASTMALAVLAWSKGQNPFFTIILIVYGVIMGAVLVWEIERRRDKD